MKLLLTSLMLVILFLPWSGNAQPAKPYRKGKAPDELLKKKLMSEIGTFVGTSMYGGDLTERYLEPLEAHFSIGLFYRKPFTEHWGLKANLMWGQLSGDDAYSSAKSGNWRRNLRFTSDVYEASAQMEFTPFTLESDYYKISPYAFAGVGFFYFDPKTEMNGNTYKLHSYKTEGTEYSLFQYCLPFGAGLKASIKNRGTIGIEGGLRKTFTDYIDDVSTSYPYNMKDLYEQNNMAFQLSYRSPTADSEARPMPEPGEGRGNPDKKDWYMFFGVTIGLYLGR